MPRAGGPAARWTALVLGNGLCGIVAAGAVVLWLAVLVGVAGRWGWTTEDPTMFRDGFTPWVVLAAVAAAVHLGVGLAVALLWAGGLPG